MPNYVFRRDEICSQLEGIAFAKFDILPLAKKAGEAQQIYASLCDNLINLIKASADHTDESFTHAWDDQMDAAQAQLKSVFDRAPTIQSLPEELRVYWHRVYTQDDAVLISFGLFAWRANFLKLVTFDKDLRTMVIELTAKWTELQTQTEGLVRPEKQAIDIMVKAVNEAIRDVATVRESVQRHLSDAQTQMEKLNKDKPTAAELLKAKAAAGLSAAVTVITSFIGVGTAVVGEMFKSAATNYLKRSMEQAAGKRAIVDAAINEYKAKMLSQGTVLNMFSSNRARVIKYREQQNIDVINRLITESDSILQKWIEKNGSLGVSSPGCRRNAELFAAEVSGWQQKLLDKCKATDLDFRTQFVGLFADTLAPKTIETLTNEVMMKEYLDSQTYGVNVGSLAQEPMLLKGVIETAASKIAESLSDPDGLDEELKVIWLSQKQVFRDYVAEYLRTFTRETLDKFIAEYTAIQEQAKSLPTSTNRDQLKKQLS